MAVTRRTGVVVTLLVVVAVLVVAAVLVRTFWDRARDTFTADTCTFGSYEVDPDQASVAATMIGAVTRYRTELPTRAQVLVLAAAMQESKLTNIPAGQGDRDSVGVLQQRPSQGWGNGKAAPLTDVGEATTEFLDALVKIDGWEKMPAAEAIQAVQISADGSLYAQHEPQATVMAAALSGRRAAAVSCRFDAPTKVASATRVARQVARELGIDTPTATDARTVRVPGARWQTAAWLVANADRLGIDRVAYSGREWTRQNGWGKGTTSEAAVVATMATTG
ncbi:hypothetical protein SAMN05443575_3947 [Jatrophihabitans endophyticus]|uniref:Uncharacterized protein n=1 Tax=Jatrophihabitans endophyticus TaxID=1206085 RepID=A0A1M5T9Q0_9ACTN|nr:hypothetical protein SAMN05443575_3947 [Jatrophihabitans endophyticus]